MCFASALPHGEGEAGNAVVEVKLAGWKMNMGKLWGKRRTAPLDQPSTLTVMQPSLRDARRRGSERDSLPRFHTTASDQLSAGAKDPLALVRSKLRIAFTPSQPVAEHRMFAGRADVLKTVIQSIEDQRLHVVLYGERGIGKTSVLHMLTRSATEARYIVIYTSCGANSTFDETFRAAAAAIPVLFHSAFGPTTAEAEKGFTLADLLPAGPVSPRQFGDLCTKLTGTRVLIILDEFDRCESGAFRRDVAEIIKNLSDRQGRVQLILAGVAADLTQLVEHIPSIRRNIFALRVPKMTTAEVLEIVTNGERAAGFSFDPIARDEVVSVAHGSPYIANLICHHAGHAALDHGRSTVLPVDVSDALARAVAEFQGRVGKAAQNQIRKLIDQGLGEVMAVVARSALSADGAFSVSDLKAMDDVDARKAQHFLDLLSAEGLLSVVEDDGGKRYLFNEEGLPTYLWILWARNKGEATLTKTRAAART